jgi:hypothetical protein
MKKIFLSLCSLAVALVLPSCLQNETTIHLNKDGSGTIVEQTTLGGQMMAMIEQMGALGGEDAKGKDPIAEMFSEDKAKARAAKMGEGVTFVKSEPVTVGANKGARVTYKFADINKVTVSPGDGMKDMSPGGDEAPAGDDEKPIVFNYADGVLTINMPEPKKPAADKKEAPEEEENPQMEAMMKQMLGDMKMSFKIVADSGISETDATNHEGNTITLMEMEMGRLLDKPDVMKKLKAMNDEGPEAAMELLKGVEGVKMETKQKVTVKLK